MADLDDPHAVKLVFGLQADRARMAG